MTLTPHSPSRWKFGWQSARTGYYWIKQQRTAPPPECHTDIGKLLWHRPAPLILPDKKVMVIYSPKSCCTQVMVWFLHQLGHLRAARDFHVWPHNYRDYVYYYSELYHNSYSMDFSGFHVIRVVRDPYERAASCFRHTVRYGFPGNGFSTKLRNYRIKKNGLSFEEFLELLSKTNLDTCDPHYRIQHHPIEDVLPTQYLINVSNENLFQRLQQIEKEIGLLSSENTVEVTNWLNELNWHKRPALSLTADSDPYRMVLSREQAQNGPWPSYDALLTPEARTQIKRYYAIDFESYFEDKNT